MNKKIIALLSLLCFVTAGVVAMDESSPRKRKQEDEKGNREKARRISSQEDEAPRCCVCYENISEQNPDDLRHRIICNHLVKADNPHHLCHNCMNVLAQQDRDLPVQADDEGDSVRRNCAACPLSRRPLPYRLQELFILSAFMRNTNGAVHCAKQLVDKNARIACCQVFQDGLKQILPQNHLLRNYLRLSLTPLMWPIALNNEAMFDALLGQVDGINVDAVLPGSQVNVLHFACMNRKPAYVGKLLTTDINKEATDEKGKRALHFAAEFDCAVSVTALLDAGVEANAPTHDGDTPLLVACKKKKINSLNALLACQRVEKETPDTDGLTPLLVCCANGFVDGVVALHAAGANMHAQGPDNLTALHFACKAGNVDFVRRCVENLGCNKDVVAANGVTPVVTACQHGKLDVVNYLVTQNVNMQPVLANNKTLLHVACQVDCVPLVQKLLELGLQAEALTTNNQTPLHIAAIHNCEAVIEYLHSLNVNLNVQDSQGCTPFWHTCVVPSVDAAIKLHTLGADETISGGQYNVKPEQLVVLVQDDQDRHTLNCLFGNGVDEEEQAQDQQAALLAPLPSDESDWSSDDEQGSEEEEDQGGQDQPAEDE